MLRWVETRVGRVAIEERGVGTPLLLLHGAGHDREDFAGLAPHFAKHFRTLAVDWPGFGASVVDAPEALGAAVLFDVLEDIVAALRLPPAVVLGNSVGGSAAVRLAARAPHAVRGLVLVDPGGFTERTLGMRSFCRVQGSPWVRRVTGRAFARAYLRRRGPAVDALIARVAAATPASVAAHAAIWRSFALPSASVADEALRVRCPVLLVWGRHDPILRLSVEGARAQRLLPGAQLHVLETGHVPFVEDPQGFLEVVDPFLAGLLAPEPVSLPSAP